MLTHRNLAWFLLPGLSLCIQRWDQFPTHEIAPSVYLPEIMIGTWVIGANTSDGKPEDSKEIARNWLDLGGRGIDTATYYRDQSFVANAVAEADVKRKAVFIETKIPGCAGSTDEAKKWVQFCLNQLSTDYIDLMLIHMPSKTPQACINTWKVLEQYHSAGALKAIGVSDFEIDDLQALLPAAKLTPAVNQLPVNIFYHNDELIKFCKERNITVQAWSPLGSPGRSTRSKYLGGHRSIFTDKTVASIAAKHNVSATQVAMRWVLQRVPAVVFESSSKAHQANDADVYSFVLSDDEVAALNSLQSTGLSLLAQGDARLVWGDLAALLGTMVPAVSFVGILFLMLGVIAVFLCITVAEEEDAGTYSPQARDCNYKLLSSP